MDQQAAHGADPCRCWPPCAVRRVSWHSSAAGGASDRTRIVRRLRRMLQLPRQRRERLWVWSPPVLPGGHSGRALCFNRRLLQAGLELVCRWLGFTNPILWTYNPLTSLYLDPEGFAGSVYHCVDRIQDQPGMPVARIEASEAGVVEGGGCGVCDIAATSGQPQAVEPPIVVWQCGRPCPFQSRSSWEIRQAPALPETAACRSPQAHLHGCH